MALNLSDLLDKHEQLKPFLEALEKEMAEIELGISLVLEADARKLFADAGKEHGKLTLKKGKRKFSAEITKRVTWDTEKLKAIAAQLPAADAAEIFRTKLEIPEEDFNNLAEMEHPLIDNIRLARSVKMGELKVKLVEAA